MYRQAKIMKHAMVDTNYVMLTKQVKLQHEKKHLEFIKYAKCRIWVNIYEIYWDFGYARILYLQEKKIVETISGHHW